MAADVAADVAPTDAGTEASSPSVPETLDQQGKLALWLEATSADVALGDGGVATWKDKSKNHNDAVASAALPTLDPSVVAGHDAVHFGQTGVWLAMNDAASLRFATGQVLITAVTKVNALRSAWFYKLADGGLGLQFFTANGGIADGGGPILSPYASVSSSDYLQWGTPELNDAKFHVVTFRRTSATAFEIAVDDVAPRTKTVATDDVSAAGAAAGLGCLPGPTTQDYWIAEEIIVHDASGVVSDADATSVHGYLKQKYGL